MDNYMKYEIIKEITKELKKAFKGIQANSYGHCCCSDYDMYHKYTNENDYVCCKLFKGGLNNSYDYSNQEFNLGLEINYLWKLTNFKLDDIIKVMQKVAYDYGAIIIKPDDESSCIKLIFNVDEKIKDINKSLKRKFYYSIENGATLEKILKYYADEIELLGFKKSMKLYQEALDDFKKDNEKEEIFDDEYNIFCYSDENGDNLVCCEHTSEYENAVAIADDLSEMFERVEILDKFGEKVY